MKNKIIIGVLILVFVAAIFWLISDQEKVDEPDVDKVFTAQEAQEIAQEWIENQSLTYTFDGEGLTLIETSVVEEGSIYTFVFSFESRSAGYGDRSDEMTAQVITSHEMMVVVDNGEVIRAITDGVYSEIDGEMIDEDEQAIAPKTKVKLFFGKMGQGEELVYVERDVEGSGSAAILKTLEMLIAGPTEVEEDDGYFTSINEETKIFGLSIQDGVVSLDFSSHLEEGVAGSATVTFIRNQIKETLLQFDSVDDVIIAIEGRTEDILQP